MKSRRWTILVVPHDSQSPKQYQLGERGVRVVAGVLGGATLLVLSAAVLLFSPWATPGARMASRENLRLQHEVEQMNVAFAQLSDTMDVIAQREAQFRELTGFTTIDSERVLHARAADSAAMVGRAALSDRPRPFASFFGNNNRADVGDLMRRAAALSSGFAVVADSMSAKIERFRNTPSIMPTKGWLVSAFSSMRMHPILHEMRPHEGIDVSATMGAPIVAPAGGTVVKVGVEGGYGNVLEVDHGNGIVTRYAHCSHILVHVGQHVDRGQTIANVGNSGLAVGPHLHYEIMVNGVHVDPLTYVLPDSGF